MIDEIGKEVMGFGSNIISFMKDNILFFLGFVIGFIIAGFVFR